MKTNSPVHEVAGIDKGEYAVLMSLSDEEFMLTVVEPESYGDSRQGASMALTRSQMYEIVSSALTVLSEASERADDLPR